MYVFKKQQEQQQQQQSKKWKEKPGLHARSYCSGISKNCFYTDWSITMARRLNIFCVRQLMGFLVPEALFVSMGWGGKKRRMGGTWEEEEVNTTLLTNHLSCHHHPHVLTLSACLESIAVSIFVDTYVFCWLNWQILYQKQRSKYAPLLIVRRGALSWHARLFSSSKWKSLWELFPASPPFPL